jgi:ABC-type dipeptide/oligopeptide/nickel transport system ATPase component
MKDGRLVEQGGREIFDAPQHPYTRTLLQAILPPKWESPADARVSTDTD